MNLYKGRFMIGIYALEQEGETLLALCESVKEFAEVMNIKETCAYVILKNAYQGKNKHIVFAKKFRTLEFIDTFL